MALLTIASAKASPGVTTTAVLLAARWPDRRLLIEADESGGVLAADLGLGETPSALELASAVRSLDDLTIGRHCQWLWDDSPVLVAPGESHRVTATYRELAGPLAAHVAESSMTGIVDAGRLTPASATWPLAAASSLVLLVARCRLAEFLPLAGRSAELRAAGARVGLVTVGSGSYDPAEFAEAAGLDLLAALPHDEAARVAQGASMSARALGRSPLWAAIGHLAVELQERVGDPSSTGMATSTASR
jgi:hypothetical protein